MANKRPLGPVKKSIDGIIPSRKQYLWRAPDEKLNAFISIRPHITEIKKQNLAVTPKKSDFDVVAGINIPKLKPIPVPKMLQQDVVVKLPYKWSFRASLLAVFQYIVFTGIAVAAAYSTSIGQLFVLVFVIYAFVHKKNSLLSFGVSFFLMLTIPLFQILNQPGVAENVSVYLYEILALGITQSIIELRKPHN